MIPKNQSGLAIVRSYSYLYEADIAKALLESEGIESWLLDEHQIRQRWHLGLALGGVKLAVSPEFASQAQELLDQDFSECLADIPEQGLAASSEEICPNCGEVAHSETSTRRFPGPIQWVVSLFFLCLGLLVPRRRFIVTRECGSCGTEWSISSTR